MVAHSFKVPSPQPKYVKPFKAFYEEKHEDEITYEEAYDMLLKLLTAVEYQRRNKAYQDARSRTSDDAPENLGPSTAMRLESMRTTLSSEG